MKIHLFEKHIILLNIIQSSSLDIDKTNTHVLKFSGRNFATYSIYFEIALNFIFVFKNRLTFGKLIN